MPNFKSLLSVSLTSVEVNSTFTGLYSFLSQLHTQLLTSIVPAGVIGILTQFFHMVQSQGSLLDRPIGHLDLVSVLGSGCREGHPGRMGSSHVVIPELTRELSETRWAPSRVHPIFFFLT